MNTQKSILIVANVAKEHICKFHIPTIRYFKEKGWRVDVACAGDEAVPFCDHQFKMHWKRSPFSIATIKGLNELKRLLNKEFYDIVYCNTPVGGLEARIAAKATRKKGTKVVYCAHGLHFYKGAPIKNWLIYYPIERCLANYTDLFLTINSEDTNLIRSRFHRKDDVFQLPGIGVDLHRLKIAQVQDIRYSTRERYHIPQDAHVLVYIAEVIKNKNQSLLVDTLRILKNRYNDVFLFLVGPIHDGGTLQAYVKKNSISDFVIFTGWQENVAAYLYAADICTASSIREGFGINLIEAMYCGLPVVATDNRGHRSIIKNGENGFLVPFSAELMAKRVAQLLQDPALCSQFSTINVSHYECNNVAKIIYSKIAALCKPRD